MDTDEQSSGAVSEQPAVQNVDRKRRWSAFWRTGLVMISSAALGGVAVALWNRKFLRTISREAENREE